MSRQELAEAVNAYVWRIHQIEDRLDRNDIGKYERGKNRWPGAVRREAFRVVLNVDSDAALGFYGSRRTAMRPAFDEDSAGLTMSPSRGPTDRRDLDEALSYFHQQWHLLVQADNLFGPRYALAGVETQIALLRDLLVAADREVRPDVVDLAARYAESAAWLNQDLARTPAAQDWTAQALEWAHQLGDTSMVAWSIYRRSQQQLEAGRARDALDLAEAALRHDERLGSPARAAIRVQQADALAALGEPAALRVLDQAHHWAANDQRGDAEAGHGSFCTPGYIETHRAMCLRLVGRPLEALAVFEQALPAIPPVYRRDTAAALVGKAAAHSAAGQPDIAAATALAALPIARHAGSGRIIGHIAAVAARLRPHRTLEPVAALLDELAVAA